MFSRPKIIVHACESRSRSQANALRCRDVITSSAIPRIDSMLFDQLQERDKHARLAFLKKGATQAWSVRPAKRVASAASNRLAVLARAGIDPKSLLPQCDGVKRKPPLWHDSDNDNDDNTKVCKTYIFVRPKRRVCIKSNPVDLVSEPAKRMRTNAHGSLLYRHL